MYCTSCAYTHHDVTTFEIDRMANIKIEHLKNGTRLFHEIKIIN